MALAAVALTAPACGGDDPVVDAATDAGTDVIMWGRRTELCKAIDQTRRNPDYLPDIELPATVRATTDSEEATAGADLVVLAVPSHTLRENLRLWAPVLPSDVPLVSLMKGIELGTAKRMSEVIAEVVGASPGRVAVVSGPNLAREIAERQPAASVVACLDEKRAQEIQQAIVDYQRGQLAVAG